METYLRQREDGELCSAGEGEKGLQQLVWVTSSRRLR